MNNAKHTPGPWEVTEVNSGSNLVYRKIRAAKCKNSSGSDSVGFAGAYEMPDQKEAEANARLIAAAPELLAACKAALPYLQDHVAMTLDEGPGDRIAFDVMEAAITKAETR